MAKLRERVKKDKDDFVAGLRGEPYVGEDASAPARDDATPGRFSPTERERWAMLAALPIGIPLSALAAGVLVASRDLPLFPWGDAVGLVATVAALALMAPAMIRSLGPGAPSTTSPNLGFLTTSAIGAVALTALWTGVQPSSMLAGAVVFAAWKGTKTRRGTASTAAVLAAVLFLPPLTDIPSLLGGPPTLGGSLRNTVQLLLFLALAGMTRLEQKSLEKERERVAQLEAEREEAVHGERSRIARELHDVVSHHVSLLAIQAEAARAVVGSPKQADAALDLVATTARTAMDELRRMLGVLRATDGGPGEVELEPQPGLTDLEELAVQARRRGVPTTLTVEPGTELPPGVGLSAYRIVQEALVNVMKHAPGAAAEVTVRPIDKCVQIEVRNGRAARPATDVGTGNGLIGMHERVALLGGTLEAGPDGQGFLVVARIPLEPVVA